MKRLTMVKAEGIIYRKNQVGMGNDPVQIIEKQRMKWRYCIDDEIIYMVSLLLCYYIIEKGEEIWNMYLKL